MGFDFETAAEAPTVLASFARAKKKCRVPG